MTPIADMVEHMLTAGLAPDVIVLAIRTAEACLRTSADNPRTSVDATTERRRAVDRERKRLEREAERLSADNPQNPRTSADDVLKEDSKLDTTKKVRKKDSMRGSRISADWSADIDAAKAEGLTETEAQRQAARFRDYWAAKPGAGGVKLDWAATWRNWCRNAADKLGCRPPAQANGQKTIFVKEGTPQWEAWCRHLGKPPPTKNFGWRFASEWPPNQDISHGERSDPSKANGAAGRNVGNDEKALGSGN